MSEGRSFEGFALVKEVGPTGMVSLRAGPEGLVRMAVALGCAVPERLQMSEGANLRVAWMSPDEMLVFCDFEAAPEVVDKAQKALGTAHGLVVNVSDARGVYRITGARAEQVIAKLCPFDRRGFVAGMIRRTRLAQVAGAVICEEDGYTIIAFRSVGEYVFTLLANAAKTGGELPGI